MITNMTKRILSLIAVGILSCASVHADTFTWVLPTGSTTNILPGPVKITQMIVTTTNATTLQLYDAPSTAFTNIVGAYSNITVSATNNVIQWTNYYGVSNGYILTNSLYRVTNSVLANTNAYANVFNQTFTSNTSTTVPNIGLTFMNGVLVTNAPYALTITVTYTGN